MKYYATHILRIQIYRKLLNARLGYLFKEEADEIESFLRAIYCNHKFAVNQTIKKAIAVLLKNGYISTYDATHTSRCTLMGVIAINFELTYKCSSNCEHDYNRAPGNRVVALKLLGTF